MSRDRCKVDDAIEDYALSPPGTDPDSLDDYLVARWTGEDGYQAVGYRRLSDWFNRQILRQVYDRNGRSTTGTRIDSEYEALTGDDSLVREEVVSELAAVGIDAESIVDDMVSPKTLHRHLTGCLGAEKGAIEAETDWERESVKIAREQLERKVEKAAGSLASKGEIRDANAADIDIRIHLACPHCATRVPLEAARRQGYVCADHSPPLPDISASPEAVVGGDRVRPDPDIDTVIEAIARFSL